jgi:curved DNA-binding protein
MDINYYKIIGVNKDASIKEIKSAYRLHSKKWHPDINHSSNAKSMMQKINEAYHWLLINHKPVIQDKYKKEESDQTESVRNEAQNADSTKEKWQNPYEKYKYDSDSMEQVYYWGARLGALMDGLI